MMMMMINANYYKIHTKTMLRYTNSKYLYTFDEKKTETEFSPRFD